MISLIVWFIVSVLWYAWFWTMWKDEMFKTNPVAYGTVGTIWFILLLGGGLILFFVNL